jgi:hypothetical protein
MSDETAAPDANRTPARFVLDATLLVEHAEALGRTAEALEPATRMLAKGDPNHVTAFAQMTRDFDRIDPVNLKVGSFDDALDLADCYKTRFYDPLAEYLARFSNAIAVGAELVAWTAEDYSASDQAAAEEFRQIEADFEE